jgi:hypothetical protein
LPLLNRERALRDLPKTPVILNVILQGVDQHRAQTATDGADGWSVLEIVGHMDDFEAIFIERVQLALEADQPKLPAYNQLELALTNRYNEQNLADLFARYVSRRREFLSLLRGLTPEQWQRQAIHPEAGAVTVLEVTLNATLHDVNHIEQIIKALGSSPTLAAL